MAASEDRQWYYVHIDHPRLVSAVNEAFHSALVGAYNQLSRPKNYRVYRAGNDHTGYSYFFSPEAERLFASLIKQWDGVGVSEPTNLENMERVL